LCAHVCINMLNKKGISAIFIPIVRPAWAQSNGCKSQVRVDSAKHIAEHQGCPRRRGIWRKV